MLVCTVSRDQVHLLQHHCVGKSAMAVAEVWGEWLDVGCCCYSPSLPVLCWKELCQWSLMWSWNQAAGLVIGMVFIRSSVHSDVS